MARTKAFDEREVLEKILPLFLRKGYHQATLDDILAVAGIGRQSLYDTYGDKRGLFLRVLAAYGERLIRDTEALVRRELAASVPAVEIVRRLIYADVSDIGVGGGLVVNTMAEFHADDEAVRMEVDAIFSFLRKTLRKLIRLGQDMGEITHSLSAAKLTEVLLNAGIGLQIGREHNLPAAVLNNAADWTVELIQERNKQALKKKRIRV